MDGAGVSETRSTCPYCGVGCGVILRPDGAGGLDVRGDPDHPANRGRLCSKGSALGDTLDRAGRLLAPRISGQEVGWDSALDLVAKKFSDTIARHGPDSVAFYVSGQLLTEDYYVANKLMKGFIGSANIDTNSRLCMASTVAGHKRGYLAERRLDAVEILAEAINPVALLQQVSRVYVCSSQLGFEALMAGRAVRCFGAPFYAGWGLTEDERAVPRRDRTRTLDELVAAALLLYPRYRHLSLIHI